MYILHLSIYKHMYIYIYILNTYISLSMCKATRTPKPCDLLSVPSLSASGFRVYRGDSLIRKRPPPGLYRRPAPRVLGGSLGGGLFLMGEVSLQGFGSPCRERECVCVCERERGRESGRARERER